MKLIVMVFALISFAQGSFAQNLNDEVNPMKSESTELQPDRVKPKDLIKKSDTIYSYSVKSIDGQLVNLSNFKGRVLMIVNVASKCGYTPQYKDLEALYRKYKDRGFAILGFPSNDFGSQEPGSNEEIKKFCKTNYDVTFPLFEKLPVKGADKQPLYKFLTEQSPPEYNGEIAWNFVKFIISRDGHVVGRFGSSTKPMDPKVISVIEERLK